MKKHNYNEYWKEESIKEMNKRVEMYIEIEDGWYSVFDLNTGFCYAQFGSKEQAEQYIKERN